MKSETYVDDKKENTWFEFTKLCESKIGVPLETVKAHDSEKGSYRAIHDHILMYSFDENFLTELSKLRMQKFNENEIIKIIESLKDLLLLKI